MAAPDMDIIKEIPGYRVILKAILKSQIQQLVEQLAANTEEESIILTASVADGTLSHLGSDSAKGFLEDHEDVKSQFLGYCLKSHHKRKQQKEQEEREAAIRKAQLEAATAIPSYAQPMGYMPRGPRTPRFAARQQFRAMGPGARHQPYPSSRPIRASPARLPPSSPSPLKSPSKPDGQVIKLEPGDTDETSNQSGGDAPPNSSQPSSPSQNTSTSAPSNPKQESADDDDKSESSSSTIPNESAQEGLGLGADFSNMLSGANEQMGHQQVQNMDPNDPVNVKIEAITESEMELEITGVEPGRPTPIMPQDWGANVSMGMNFDPTGATGSPGDMASQQGYNELLSQSSYPSCTVCGRLFASNSLVRRHMRSHTGERPFRCDFCTAAFFMKHHLGNHMKHVHPEK